MKGKLEFLEFLELFFTSLCISSFGEAPTLSQVEEFKRICSHFFEQHPGEIIGGYDV